MTTAAPGEPGAFDVTKPWGLHPQVALRDEAFGGLAYHYGTRRLVFLKSRPLVDLVRSLGEHDSAAAAIEAVVDEQERPSYETALARLATSEVIGVR
jgi:putative mycofactocin binding protein MftB